jgi:hypothetical protein
MYWLTSIPDSPSKKTIRAGIVRTPTIMKTSFLAFGDSSVSSLISISFGVRKDIVEIKYSQKNRMA